MDHKIRHLSNNNLNEIYNDSKCVQKQSQVLRTGMEEMMRQATVNKLSVPKTMDEFNSYVEARTQKVESWVNFEERPFICETCGGRFCHVPCQSAKLSGISKLQKLESITMNRDHANPE
jgi:hypothetical protein